jgi:hypothetical protein
MGELHRHLRDDRRRIESDIAAAVKLGTTLLDKEALSAYNENCSDPVRDRPPFLIGLVRTSKGDLVKDQALAETPTHCPGFDR